MNKIVMLLAFLPLYLFAQEKGVHFQHNISWAEVQAKAKAENKYIFMDCFTTWCGPCKYMSNTVFPQEKMGSYFNDKFINVKVQLDSTKNDNEDVQKWYGDAHDIMVKYNVRAYPTFLFFSPEGKIVHRMVGGGEADEFIKRASVALDPETQYYTSIEKYDNGERAPEFLRKTALAAQSAYDQESFAKIAAEYLSTQKDLFTKENIEFLDQSISSSKDKGFDVFLKNPGRVNAILGKNKAEKKIRNIALREEVFPKLDSLPDWKGIEKNLTKKYPKQTPEIVGYSKLIYYRYKNDWQKFQTNLFPYLNKYSANLENMDINNYVWDVFLHCNDVNALQQAAKWSKQTIGKDNNPMFYDTYANILYRLGKKTEALTWEKKAIALLPENERKNYQDVIDKMNKGEKTWID